jgi:hypothetical protein
VRHSGGDQCLQGNCQASPLSSSKIFCHDFCHQHHSIPPSISITMAKSKAKRKQQITQADASSKKQKTAAIVTPPPEKDASQPKTIQSIGLDDDDLDIAIDTLNTLAQHPSVIKSKACKDLRTAVYEFRQACTTGFNASGISSTPPPLQY